MIRIMLLASAFLAGSAASAQQPGSYSWYFIDGSLYGHWVQYGPFHSLQQCEAVRSIVHQMSKNATSSCWHV